MNRVPFAAGHDKTAVLAAFERTEVELDDVGSVVVAAMTWAVDSVERLDAEDDFVATEEIDCTDELVDVDTTSDVVEDGSAVCAEDSVR